MDIKLAQGTHRLQGQLEYVTLLFLKLVRFDCFSLAIISGIGHRVYPAGPDNYAPHMLDVSVPNDDA